MSRLASADQTLIKAEDRTLIWAEPLPERRPRLLQDVPAPQFLDPLRHWFVPYRVEREYRLLERLHECGIPCTEPISWSHGRTAATGCHEILVTREIPSVVPLKDLTFARTPTRAPDLAPLFALARRMHECGVAHGAFYAANILLSCPGTDPARFHVIDLAHGCRFSQGIVGTRPAEYDLLDMLRSIERVMPIDGPRALGRRLRARRRRHGATAREAPGAQLERPWRHIRRAETDAREFLRPRAGRAAVPPSAGFQPSVASSAANPAT